jgi:hypothetical protein
MAQGGLFSAALSPSCLLRPEIGDKVLAFRSQGEAFILSVLQRAQGPQGQARLDLPDQAVLSGKALRINSQVLEVESGKAAFRAGRLSLEGGLMTLGSKVLSLAAKHICLAAQKALGRFQSLQAQSSEDMALSAGSIRLSAEGQLLSKSGSLDLEAEGAARIDGRSLMLG